VLIRSYRFRSAQLDILKRGQQPLSAGHAIPASLPRLSYPPYPLEHLLGGLAQVPVELAFLSAIVPYIAVDRLMTDRELALETKPAGDLLGAPLPSLRVFRSSSRLIMLEWSIQRAQSQLG
jgi:hypothetical protein